MLRPRLLLLLALFAIPATAAPLQITGRVLHPPKDVQVELRPWAVERAEVLRRLRGETVPPIASVHPRADGSFTLRVPDSGFYSVVARAEGHVAMERFVPFVVEETEVPAVELAAASPLEVKAVGADGQPLAGVTIQAIPLKPESGDWRAAERSAITDAEGRAVFHRAEGEALRLVVTTPGRYSTVSTDPRGASQTVRFPARRNRVVEFRGANGKPAIGALVRLSHRGWPYGLTGEDGRIPLPVPEENEIGLIAEDSQGLRIEVVMTVESGEGTDVPVVGLRPPTAAAGRVLEEKSREPIAGALVWNGSFGGMAWTRTGSEGSFELRAPSGDQGRVEATAPGHTRASSRWQRDAVAPITFLLGPAANLTGQVVDEAGKPIEGAKVETLTNPADYRMARTEEKRSWTGPDGRFTLRQVPAGRVHTVMASKEGFAPTNRIADSTAPVRLTLRHGTVAAGRVVDEQGRPVEGAELILHPADQDPAPRPPLRFRAVSDAQGGFRMANVSAGRFDLRVTRPGSAETDVRGIVIPEGEARADLGEITLLPGAAIEGIVVDERDRPVQGAEIELAPFGPDFDARLFFREPIQSGSDGRFRIADLPRGTRVVLKARHPDLAPAEMAGVEAPTAEPVRLRLTRPRSLEGRVGDRHGEPVDGARLHFSETAGTPIGGGWAQQPAQATSDAEGRFVLSGLKPGTAYVTATASGYRTRSAQPVEIPEEGQAPPLEITLEPGTFLEGTVRDSRGEPVPDARVHVQGMEAIGIGSEMIVPADDQGRFEVADLEPGPFRVQASSRRGPSARAELEVRPGRNRLDLTLSEGTEVSGRIVDGQGAPVPGASLSLRSVPKEGEMPMAALGEIQAVSTGDGSFAFQGISDGEYRLTGTRQGYAPATLPRVQVDGAPVSGLELRLGPGAVIRGRLLGLDPADVSRVRVMAHSPDQEIHLFGAVDPSGTYRIQDVPPGAWDLMAHFNFPDGVRARVEVSPGEQEVVQDLELPSGFTLTGRVLLDRSPLPRARIFVSNHDPERPIGVHQETAHDGTFRMDRLAAGSYVLRVLGATGMLHGEALEISGDRDVTIEITTGAVEGRLLSPEGLPVAGATVSLTGEDPRFFYLGPETSSDDQGAFAMPGVAAGTYKVTVKAEGFAPAEGRVVVTPGGTARVDLLLTSD